MAFLSDNRWQWSTLVFYLLITLACWGLSVGLQKIKIINERYKSVAIAAPFLILLFIKGFAYCGVDLLEGYKESFARAISFTNLQDSSLEIGYKLVNIIVRNITEDYRVLVFLLALLTLIPVFYVINKHKNNILPALAILGYSSIFFVTSFDLIRIYLAGSICLLSFDAIYEKKYTKATIIVLIAMTFHFTSIVMLIPCIFLIFKFDKKVFWGAMGFLVLFIYMGRTVLKQFFSGRYQYFEISETLHIGTEWIWYYAPLIVLFIYICRIAKKEKVDEKAMRMVEVSFYWVVMGIAISFIQYAVSMLGRLIAFTTPFVFFISSALAIIKVTRPKQYKWLYFLSMGYFVLRFVIYLTDYYVLDGVMPYFNSFGWEI